MGAWSNAVRGKRRSTNGRIWFLMPDWHGTTGRDDLVGGARVHLDYTDCNHRFANVCPECAKLSDEEVSAIRQYLRLLREKADEIGQRDD